MKKYMWANKFTKEWAEADWKVFLCEDCGIDVQGSKEDEISYFNSDRCHACEAKMYRYMATDAAKEISF